jgi:cytochrome c-type biogenesis protein CcmE
MKLSHIIMLVAIAVIIGLLISTMTDLSTYDTIASARHKQGKFVHLIARLDTTQGKSVMYDPFKDPNYLQFHVVDSLGNHSRVIYRKGQPPTDMQKSERMVLKGRMSDSAFLCEDILIKCPSKYKEGQADISLNENR